MHNSRLIQATRLTVAVALALLAVAAWPSAQTGSPVPGSREAMWPAPTVTDWELPCLIDWQRSFEDAVVVAKETGKPILICVNMDGEIASEHYAGIRYRREDTAGLYDPYVTVIASVYRHTPRDFDDTGQRVLCPRFGSVTCGEHIAIEPGLFDGFFEGTRVAPRHVMVELEESGGYSESYDVYYAFDTDSVFETIVAGIVNRPIQPAPFERSTDLLDRIASQDNADRTFVEQSYRTGTRETKRKILQALAGQSKINQRGLLRLALFDLDLDLVRLARISLSNSSSADSIDLILEALRLPCSDEEREALVAALERIGESSQRARTLAVVHRGMEARSETLDVSSWAAANQEQSGTKVRNGLSTVSPKLEYKAQASRAFPEDASSKLELAEAYLSYGVNPDNANLLAPSNAQAQKYAALLFEDALRAATRAEELGLSSWRVDAVIALANTYLGNRELGFKRAEQAAKAMPPGAEGWTAMATLAVFAQSRQRAIFRAERDNASWPAEWLTDVNAAYSVLASSPYGTEAQAIAHYDFIWSLGVPEQADLLLEDGLERFPGSWQLHERLRARAFKVGGLEQLEAVYAARLSGLKVVPEFRWYAGYASLVTAEFQRRAAEPDEASAAYRRAVAHFESTITDEVDGSSTGANHYIALALAGEARLAMESGDFDSAVEKILASFSRWPEAAATLDGLGLTPVATAQMLEATLRGGERIELADRVQAGLDALDPRLLIRPAFDRGDSAAGRRDLRRRPARGNR